MIIITMIILTAHGNGNYSNDNIKKTDRKKNEKHCSQYLCVNSNININMEKVTEKIDMIRWDSIIKKSTST